MDGKKKNQHIERKPIISVDKIVPFKQYDMYLFQYISTHNSIFNVYRMNLRMAEIQSREIYPDFILEGSGGGRQGEKNTDICLSL